MKIREKLERLRRLAPNRSATGQLYKKKTKATKKFVRISMYTLLVSSENTHQIHEAVFNKVDGKNSAEWAEWFSRHFEEIYVKGILAGIGIRTEKQWSVQKIIGWVGHVEYTARSAKVGRKRHKTKRQGSKNGQIRVRRRHRNAKR